MFKFYRAIRQPKTKFRARPPTMESGLSTSSKVRGIHDYMGFHKRIHKEAYFVTSSHVRHAYTGCIEPDGHCGFRSVDVGLRFTEKQWFYIRQLLLEEIEMLIFDDICQSINWLNVASAPR